MKGGIDFIQYLDIRYVKKIEGLGKGNEAFLSHQSIPKGGGGLQLGYDALQLEITKISSEYK